jgi:hypothetical protein
VGVAVQCISVHSCNISQILMLGGHHKVRETLCIVF